MLVQLWIFGPKLRIWYYPIVFIYVFVKKFIEKFLQQLATRIVAKMVAAKMENVNVNLVSLVPCAKTLRVGLVAKKTVSVKPTEVACVKKAGMEISV